jgi:molybdate transport system substrate-binding protein
MVASHFNIFSAGAPKTGIAQCAETFCAEDGCSFDIRFATAPVLRAEVEGGDVADDVINAPMAAQADFEAAGLTVAGTTTPIGSIRAAVVVPSGAPDLDIASVDDLVACLHAADRVVFNQASSGQYIVEMIERLGLAAALAEKTERVATGNAVMEALAATPDENAIGFGQTTEIRRLEHIGVRLVGPLPGNLDKVTAYAAALNTNATAPGLARRFLDFLDGAVARNLLTAAGME